MSIRWRDDKPIWVETNRLPDISTAPLIAIDTETKDERLTAKKGPGGVTHEGYICGISIAVDGWSGYISLRHPDSDNWSMATVRRWFRDFMCTDTPKLGANILYDLEWLRAEGFPITGPFYDVQVAEPLLNESLGRYNLASLMKRYLGGRMVKGTEGLKAKAEALLGPLKGDIREHIWRMPSRLVGAYAELDVLGPLALFPKQQRKLKREKLLDVFDLESRLTPLLLDMRFQGTRIDINRVDEVIEKVGRKRKREQKKLDALAGMKVEVSRSASIAPAFDAAGLPYPLSPKAKKPSFTKDYMKDHDHPLPRQIVKVKEIDTLVSLFLEGGIKKYVHGDRLYTQFHQLKSDEFGTVSGRFSSSNPNLQQQPKRNPELASLVRSLFLPEDGCDWWKNDWSQIEYRLIVHYASWLNLEGAHIARDQYQEDSTTDFHAYVGEMMGLTGQSRELIKGINFGVAYTMGIEALSGHLGVPLDETEELMKLYHRTMPFIRELSNRCSSTARTHGYIRTLQGRKRRFALWEPYGNYKNDPDWVKPVSSKPQAYGLWPGRSIVRAYVYRAMNSLIQGSAADMMKMAMVDCYEGGVFKALGTPSLTVHDELDGSKEKTRAGDEALQECVHIMEQCMPLEIPVLVDCETGKDWWNVKAISN